MARLLLLPAVLALVVAACGGPPEEANDGPHVPVPAGVKTPAKLPAAEERLDLVAPPGYADGTDFERRTGCRLTVREEEDPAVVERLLASGRYDGGLAAGDVTVSLIGRGAIAPVNTELVPNFAGVLEGLRNRHFNAAKDRQYALAVGRAANQLVYRRDRFPGSLARLGAIFERAQVASVGSQMTVPDTPHHIAEAALWASRRPQFEELEITDPYELDREQFDAVVQVLRLQHPYVDRYWRTSGEAESAFVGGDAIVGLAPLASAATLEAIEARPLQAALPREGASGIAPGWMVAARAAHPGCMYRFLDHALSPAVNARVARDNGLAPSHEQACDALEREGDDAYCDAMHATDEGYWEKVLFRTLPTADCGDERGRACMDWARWQRAWRDVVSGG